ncbi:MAG TPA: IclR family transcriptional regulator [Bryobacteraceae bacterium]|nr:IclR family transcriptional regulator [Bryobacteraceae bacterium]
MTERRAQCTLKRNLFLLVKWGATPCDDLRMPARNHVELVEKTVLVLTALAEGASSLGDIAVHTGLAKSTAFRVLYTLRELGWVEQAGRNGAYCLSFRMLAVARQGTAEPSLPRVARPHMTRLRDLLQESVWLAEVRGRAVVLVDVVEALQKLRLLLEIGNHCPYHATALGKVIAAQMSAAELDAVLGSGPLQRFTARTLTDRGDVETELARVRRDGFAVNDEETVDGAFLTAAPVFDCTGRAIAALSISAPTARCNAAKRKQMTQGVLTAAVELTAELQSLSFRSGKLSDRPAAPASEQLAWGGNPGRNHQSIRG